MVKISQAVKNAQQSLSDKFNIPTFNLKGGVSTVPISGKINKGINVGIGSSSNRKSFNKAVQSKIQASKNSGKKSSVFKNSPITAPSKKTINVPKVLSQATIDRQQSLSDQFNIPTFNLKGGISTIPSNLIFSDINVGRGRFKTDDAFVDAIVDKANSFLGAPKPASGSGGSGAISPNRIPRPQPVFFDSNPIDLATGFTTEETGLSDESSDTIQDEFLFGGSGGQSGDIKPSSENDLSFFDGFINDPIKLGIGIIILTAIVFSTTGKKRKR